MVDYTANLKLRVPVFDQDPWDADVNSNWYTLDAAVSKFYGVANLTGNWVNDTAYSVGQSAVDYTDGSIWQCNMAHTSAATGTFFADRAAHPSYWTESISTAQEYAQAAATSASASSISATAAAASALDAATSAASVTGLLPLAGGTMTGDLILNADPTDPLGATTKQYVDAQVGGVNYLPLAGGTLSGPLTLPGNPILALEAAPKQYVDLFMPKTGGNFTGPLNVTGNVTSSGIVYGNQVIALSYSSAQLASDATATSLIFDGGLWRLQYNRATGDLYYVRGSDSVILMDLQPSGNVNFLGTVAGAAISSSNNFTMFSNVNTSWLRFDSNNWTLQYARATGRLSYVNGSGTELMALDGSGTLGIIGTLNVAGSIGSGAQINTVNLLVTGSAGFANASDFALFASGTNRYQQYASTWFWAWETTSGKLWWSAGGAGYFWMMDNGTTLTYNQLGPVGGHGAYQNLSDERMKTGIVPSDIGMKEIRLISPIRFVRNNKEREEIGFSAQALQQIIPEAVSPMTLYQPEKDPEERLTISSEPIVAALVNAVKQLDQRLTTLEGHSG